MLQPSIRIDGLRQLDKNLQALGAELGSKVLTGALRDAADPMLNDMKSNAPVSDIVRTVKSKGGSVEIRPGFLKSRIKKRANRNRLGRVNKKFGKGTVAIVRVGAFRVPYVVAIEYGTTMNRKQGGYTKAHPFIRPALDKSPQVISLFKERIERRIYLAARKLVRQRGSR